MKSNVDYTICPKCLSINAAMWYPTGKRSYEVCCTVCGFEFEHGHYAEIESVMEVQHPEPEYDSDPYWTDGEQIVDPEDVVQFLLVNGYAHREDDYND